MESNEHLSVLLDEAVTALLVDKEGKYVDGTFGRGGHSAKILGGLSEGGRLLAIDKDEQAVAVGGLRFENDSRFMIEQGSFADLTQFVKQRDWQGQLSGVLLDLGVSSPQLDQADRGFSFLRDGPLDMRMDTSKGITAAEWVNSAGEADIIRVLKEYGEERFARRMAKAILDERVKAPIVTTAHLAKLIAEANPAWEKGKHPATRAFQAIRIHINDELDDLKSVLAQALEMLAVGGRLVVISFHSLEDRIVKRFMQHHAKGDVMPAGLPITEDKLNKRFKRLDKAIKPSQKERQANPRARSAVMRVAEKIA